MRINGFHVAGVTYDGRQRALAAYARHKGRKYCELRREPENPHDANAIAVWAHLRRADGAWAHMRLGYVPAPLARALAPAADAGGRLWAEGAAVVGWGMPTLGMELSARVI